MVLIGDNMKKRRSEIGLTQDELARKSGVSQTCIADLERGRTVSSGNIIQIAKALGLTAEELQSGKWDKQEDDGSFKRLMSVLKENGMTQTELANRLDLDGPQVVNNWKRRGVPRGMAIDIGSVLGVNPKWLIDGIDGKYGENPITADEIALLAGFRALTPSDQKVVLDVVKALVGQGIG